MIPLLRHYSYFSEQQFHQFNSKIVNTYKLFNNQLQEFAIKTIFFYQNHQNQLF